MKNLILILLACSVGYGAYYHYNRPVEEPIVDPEIEMYVSEWKADCERRGIDLPFEWKDIESITAIYEYTDGDDRIGGINRLNKTIEIKADYDPAVVRCIVYHELGHYVLRLDHSHSSGEIMSAEIMTAEAAYYGVNWDRLVDTYFESYEQ
jgi:hypothetical protein